MDDEETKNKSNNDANENQKISPTNVKFADLMSKIGHDKRIY